MENNNEVDRAINTWSRSKELRKETSEAIDAHIRGDIYKKFPRLQKRMAYLAHKLMLSYYCQGNDLGWNEAKTLVENDYHKM